MSEVRPRVLIVDDEVVNLTALSRVLEEDFEITLALDGSQAIRRAHARPAPSLILLDVTMPVVGGFQVCKALKAHPATADIPVIFITGRDSEEDEGRGLALGAVDFIAKPIRPAILRARATTHVMLQEQKRRLAESESLLKATLESTKDGILVLDADGSVKLMNQRFAEMWWMPEPTAAELADCAGLMRIMGPQLRNPAQFHERMCRLRATEQVLSDTLELTDGRMFSTYSMPLQQDGEYGGRVWSFTDVTDEKRLEQQLHHLSVTDELTGLHNRRYMNKVLVRELERARRHGPILGCLLCDLDRFKRVNDTYGHERGDAVLRALARVMMEQLRQIDTCCRYGGEEFCILMPDTTAHGLVTAAERLRAAVETTELEGLAMTISIGCSLSTQLHRTNDGEELLALADQALYRAKAEGRNRACMYGEG